MHIERLGSNCFIRMILVLPKALVNTSAWGEEWRTKEKTATGNRGAKEKLISAALLTLVNSSLLQSLTATPEPISPRK